MVNTMPCLLPLRGAIKHYAWGSRTFLAGLAGRPSPSPLPEAELWMGAHPEGAAQVWSDGRWVSLRDLIASDPIAVLGAASVERFGVEAPFLLKILAIDRPLSLQTHPDREQAAAGFEREREACVPIESRSYRDPGHKPELIVALEQLWVLRGLREPSDIRRRFGDAGIESFAPETDRLVRRGGVGLRDFLAALLGITGAARARLIDDIQRAAQRARESALVHEAPLYWVARLAELYPDDPAALAPLFLHLVGLAPGQGAFQPPRLLHSYLEGVGIEVMAGSDNVVRAGLTPKPVDTAELLAVIDPVPAAPTPILAVADDRGAARYAPAVEEFELWRLTPRAGLAATLDGRGAPVIAICTRGAGRVAASRSGESLVLEPGGAFFARAGVGPLEVDGDLDLYAATVAGRGFNR